MTEVAATQTDPNGDYVIVTWTGLTTSDTGAPVKLARFSDKTVHVKSGGGAGFGSGATVVIQGSNDGVTWVTLNDVFENPISIGSEAIAAIAENPFYIRPSVSGGTSPDLDIIICAKRG